MKEKYQMFYDGEYSVKAPPTLKLQSCVKETEDRYVTALVNVYNALPQSDEKCYIENENYKAKNVPISPKALRLLKALLICTTECDDGYIYADTAREILFLGNVRGSITEPAIIAITFTATGEKHKLWETIVHLIAPIELQQDLLKVVEVKEGKLLHRVTYTDDFRIVPDLRSYGVDTVYTSIADKDIYVSRARSHPCKYPNMVKIKESSKGNILLHVVKGYQYGNSVICYRDMIKGLDI